MAVYFYFPICIGLHRVGIYLPAPTERQTATECHSYTVSLSNLRYNQTLQLDLVTNTNRNQMGHLETIYLITLNATSLIN